MDADGIAAGATLSLLNYLILGFTFAIDGYYLHSFEVWLACTVVFPGSGNIGFSVLQYRLGLRNLVRCRCHTPVYLSRHAADLAMCSLTRWWRT
jgi:hypothetical protein